MEKIKKHYQFKINGRCRLKICKKIIVQRPIKLLKFLKEEFMQILYKNKNVIIDAKNNVRVLELFNDEIKI